MIFSSRSGRRDDESAAQAGHAVGFRKRAKHDHIFARLDEIERGGSIAKMNVGFVNHHDGTFRFVFDEILDVGVRSQRAGRIIGIADVEHVRRPDAAASMALTSCA